MPKDGFKTSGTKRLRQFLCHHFSLLLLQQAV